MLTVRPLARPSFTLPLIAAAMVGVSVLGAITSRAKKPTSRRAPRSSPLSSYCLTGRSKPTVSAWVATA